MHLMCLFLTELNFSANSNPKSATNYKQTCPFTEDDTESKKWSYTIEKLMAYIVLEEFKDLDFESMHSRIFEDRIFDHFYNELLEFIDEKVLPKIARNFEPIVLEMRCKIKKLNFAKVIQEVSLRRFQKTIGANLEEFLDKDLRNFEQNLETTISEATSILARKIPKRLKKIAYKDLVDYITRRTHPIDGLKSHVNNEVENLMKISKSIIFNCLAEEIKKEIFEVQRTR